MSRLIAKLFGGRDRPPDPNPLPGIGGYHMPPGPAGETGFPGSTSATRAHPASTPPRSIGLRTDRLGGANNALGSTPETRQVAYRGDVAGAAVSSPRGTGSVTIPQTAIRQEMQHNSTRERNGGVFLRTGSGNDTAGANPLSSAQRAGGHSVRDTETPGIRREPVIGTNTPGAQNVRNTRAYRYRNPAGQIHTYQSAPNPAAPPSSVTVPNRFVFPGGGNTTWSVQREMPYGGRGDGARGAALDGTRYYGTGQADQFWNAGQGDYGISRQRGSRNRRPVSFSEPGPWTANFYDTTESVGTTDNPGTGGQAPNLVYTSPSAGRASNATGRTH